MARLRRVVIVAMGSLTVAALVRELRLPPSRRTWHGRVAGVPYDFRRPTWRRLRQRWWNPSDPRLFTDRAVGLGWDINLARLTGRTSAPSKG